MKPNKIIDMYETACEFTRLSWSSKLCIGSSLCLIDSDDWTLADDELEELVFTRAIKENLFVQLKEEIYHFTLKEDAYEKRNSRKVFN